MVSGMGTGGEATGRGVEEIDVSARGKKIEELPCCGF
jgi:hypothetical protein